MQILLCGSKSLRTSVYEWTDTSQQYIKKGFEQIFIVLSSFKETKHIFPVPKHTDREKTHTVKQDTWGETVNESKDWKSPSHKYTIEITYQSCDRLSQNDPEKNKQLREWLAVWMLKECCSNRAMCIISKIILQGWMISLHCIIFS